MTMLPFIRKILINSFYFWGCKDFVLTARNPQIKGEKRAAVTINWSVDVM